MLNRTGDRKEALGGPLIYAMGLFIGTVLFFRLVLDLIALPIQLYDLAVHTVHRDSTVGVVALSQMAAGDGLADIIGRYSILRLKHCP